MEQDRRAKERRKPMPEAISIQQTAVLLDVSEITIRRWIKRGFLLAHRVGPHLIRIPRTEIIRMRLVRVPYTNHRDRIEYPAV